MLEGVLVRGSSLGQLAELLECSRTLVDYWRKGARFPGDDFRERLADKLGIPVESWDYWRIDESTPSSSSKPKAQSEPSAIEVEEPFEPRELGTTEEELQISLRRITDRLEGRYGRPSHAQAASLEARRVQVLRTLAGLEASRGIDSHPDFPAVLEDLVRAVVESLGPDAPDGIEGRIADRFEALQAARQGDTERRAA